MFTEDKVTEIFCMADDFCKFFDAMMKKYTIKEARKRNYHRDGTLSKAEVMVIMILFHNSGYRCLKHFYLEHVCRQLRHLFPEVVSYNRFVEHSRHRSFDNFIVNICGILLFPKEAVHCLRKGYRQTISTLLNSSNSRYCK